MYVCVATCTIIVYKKIITCMMIYMYRIACDQGRLVLKGLSTAAKDELF